MDKALRLAAGAVAVGFVLVGLGWWVAPKLVGARFGMPLLDGVGLSTQVADLASFFLTLGGCILLGLTTGTRVWLYPALMLLGFAVVGRTLAWALHGAALAYEAITVELVAATLLLLLSRGGRGARSVGTTAAQ